MTMDVDAPDNHYPALMMAMVDAVMMMVSHVASEEAQKAAPSARW